MLRIFNSFTHKKEKFKPIKDKEVSIYVCGITPYDTTHLGHAFTYVFFDVLIRYLRYKGYKVKYTQNVTDIDDDILKKAREENKNWREFGSFWTRKFTKEMGSLNVLSPTHFVKATGSIERIKKIIQKLLDKNYAYESGRNIYFDISKFRSYGRLSKYTRHQMIILSRQRGADPSDPNKRDPLDFILWQKSKKDEPSWNTPFEKRKPALPAGRPGWHIECSAMISEFLGDKIDIHGGGKDLIFPHHESEVAQSESYTGKKPFVRYWMHTAMVISNGEKMSKSLGNLVMIDSLLKNFSSDAIRWYLLSNHYRSPWEYDVCDLVESEEDQSVIRQALLRKSKNNIETDKKITREFESFMNDDLNIPEVLKLMLGIARKINGSVGEDVSNLSYTLKLMTSILGFQF